jgi:hypothetical protein
MTASDKKKTALLVLLLAGAGVSWSYVSRPVTGTAPTVATKVPGKAKAVNVAKDSQIRIDKLENTSAINVGKKNLFEYGQKPAPSKQPDPQRGTGQNVFVPAVVTEQRPPAPVVQPFKAFKYEGFSVSKGGGKILGSITESGTTFEVKEGDCMMGMYCITRLTETLVEIEDLQLKRKQTFAFTRTQ